MADDRKPVEAVSLWKTNSAPCANRWFLHADEIQPQTFGVLPQLETGCEYLSLARPGKTRPENVRWPGVSRFGIALGSGMSRIAAAFQGLYSPEGADMATSFRLREKPLSIGSFTARSDSFLNLGVDAGLFVFRIFTPPRGIGAPDTLQDDNLGRFPADLPSISICY